METTVNLNIQEVEMQASLFGFFLNDKNNEHANSNQIHKFYRKMQIREWVYTDLWI
jgi:hypothetical protein